MLEALRRTQKGVGEEIERALENGMLPQSILFSGPRGSSRLTGALDLSFHLTGEDDKRESLRSARIMYISSRNMQMEANAAISLFMRQRNARSRDFLIQAIRKGLLQYHSSIAPIYDSKKSSVKLKDDEGRGGTLFSNADALDALLIEFETADPGSDRAFSIADDIRKRTPQDFFTLGKKTPGATIDEIRGIQDWLEEGIEEKCVIIENPEDFTEGAKNSMLKMLEEPPMHSHLILLSVHPSRILPTILSRVRHFRFPELPEAVVSSFIGEVFSIYGNYPSFDSFFFEEGTDEEERSAMKEAVSIYSGALLDGRLLSLDEENRIFSGLEKVSGYEYFRLAVASEIEKALKDGKGGKRVRAAWKALSEAAFRSDTYNMSMRISLDSALREAAIGK